MDAPSGISGNNLKNTDNKIVPYNDQGAQPQVAINEELVQGALSWTTKFQLHLASNLGTEVINIQNVPPQLQKMFFFMETLFSRADEEEGNQMIAQIQPAIEELIAKKKDEELRKLAYAGVRSHQQLKQKEQQVYSLVDKAINAYLTNPSNIQNRVNIDLAMARTKFGSVTDENRTIILNFWNLVVTQPEYYKRAQTLEAGFIGFSTLNSVDDLMDETKKTQDIHIILKVMEIYTSSAKKLKDDMRNERDASRSASDVVLYDYMLLKAEVIFSALVWELIKSTFADKIKRSEDLLESFVETTKKSSLSNIAIFQSLVDSGFDSIGYYQKMLNRHLDDALGYMHEFDAIENLRIYKARMCDIFEMMNTKLEIIWTSYSNVLESQQYIAEERAKTNEDMRERALEVLIGFGVMNPIEARQILASQPESEKTLFKALIIATPLFEKLVNKDVILLLEEIRFDLVNETDPVNNFVKLYEERDQRIMSLFGTSKVEEVKE